MPATRKDKPIAIEPVAERRPYRIEDGVTQSLLQSWKVCRRSCRMGLDGWQPDTTRDVLSFGTMVHWLLEHLYRDPYEFIPPWRQAEIAEEGLTAGEFMTWAVPAFFGRKGGNGAGVHRYDSGAAVANLSNENMATAAMANPLVEAYVNYWGEEDAQYEWVALEKLFDVNFRGFRLRGKIDGIFRRPDGKLWIFETKTKGQISPEDIGRALKFDFQSLFYITAVEAMMGEAVTGVKYNVLRRTQLRRGKQETDKAFYDRIRADIESRPDFYFYRTEAVFTPAAKKQFQAELECTLYEFREWAAPGGSLGTYKNETACTMRKWNCDFLDACAGGNMVGYNQDKVLFGELEDEA